MPETKEKIYLQVGLKKKIYNKKNALVCPIR